MPYPQETTKLAQTIRSNLLGVLPMDQEIQLEDRDRRLSLEALEPSAPEPVSRCSKCDGTCAHGSDCHVPRGTSTPEPTCDAPLCDCADGTDCKANVTAKPAWTLTRENIDRIEDVLSLSDGREAIWYAITKGVGYGVMKEALDVLWSGLDGTIPVCRPKRDSAENPRSKTPVPTLSERILEAVNGLTAKIEVLAERLPDSDAHTVRVVSPTEIDREGGVDVWYLDPAFQGHQAPFAMGDALTDSSAYRGIWQVISVGQRYEDKKIELRLNRHPGFVFDTEAF